MEIAQTLADYLTLQQKMQEYRLKTKELTKAIKSLEDEIKDYMTKHSMDEIKLDTGNIVLYNKKVPQTFKKEVIKEKLENKLQNAKQAEELANVIVDNKTFTFEEKIKVVLKKK
jgi:hypothetical protein